MLFKQICTTGVRCFPSLQDTCYSGDLGLQHGERHWSKQSTIFAAKRPFNSAGLSATGQKMLWSLSRDTEHDHFFEAISALLLIAFSLGSFLAQELSCTAYLHCTSGQFGHFYPSHCTLSTLLASRLHEIVSCDHFKRLADLLCVCTNCKYSKVALTAFRLARTPEVCVL